MYKYSLFFLGGLSGVVGKMTGVLGDTFAKLTFDEEFQDKRSRGGSSVGQGLEGVVKVSAHYTYPQLWAVGIVHGVSALYIHMYIMYMRRCPY